MTDPLMTERLVLRRFSASDIDTITAVVQRFEVTSMLPLLPWPYTRNDAATFLADKVARETLTFAITRDGALIGSVSADGQLGYWLHPDHWGQGLATEAARAVLTLHFACSDAPVPSGHRLGNARSRAVLRKLGFTDTALREVYSNADAKTVTLQDMTLTRAAWEGRT